jgi:hypothetical protein
MKDRKNSSSRQQGDTGRQGQGQQSQQTSDRKNKGTERSPQGSNTHRTQQR